MQTAYREAKVLTPTENLAITPGHTVVLWSPEKLVLAHKQVGIQIVPAREFIQLHDQVSVERDTSEAFFSSDLSVERSLVRQVKTAYACALEINISYGARGAVILDSLLDVSEAAVLSFEQKLASVGWFTEPRLDGLIALLSKITPSNQGEAEAITRLEQGINTAIEYRLSKVDDWIGEAQRAREGKPGRATLTREEYAYATEIGLEIPQTLTSPMPQAGVGMAEVEQRLEQNNMAFAETLAAALNNFGEKLLATRGATNEVNETSNTKESGEETGKPKPIPAVGKSGRTGQQQSV